MLKALLLITLAVASGEQDAATKQLVYFKEKTRGPIGVMTTAAGAPVDNNEAMSTLNTELLSSAHAMEELSSFSQERIPERTVHALGAGAFGYFETTNDITHICKAKLFSRVGKRTPIAVRFSLVASQSGGSDTSREVRGFAVKFYTEEGNFDLPGLNTPIFTVKEPLRIPTVTHALKRNPVTNFANPNSAWDFITLNPESLFQFMHVFSDYGMPVGYDHMAGHAIHTYQVYNEAGASSFVRFHFVPDAGEKYLNTTEATTVAAGDRDYYARKLYDSIANHTYPSWKLKIQILCEDDVKKSDYEAFDVTKIIPTDKYPLHTVGTFTLNRNPQNYFAEIEQMAFSPGNLVPGILGNNEKIFLSRTVVYRDSAIYRLGKNFKNIPVNYPIYSKPLTYYRDGRPPVGDNGNDSPSYYPNSFNGPMPYKERNKPSILKIYEKPANNTEQVRNFYSNVLTEAQRSGLVENIVTNMCDCETFIKKRAINIFTNIHSDFGDRLAAGLADCASQ